MAGHIEVEMKAWTHDLESIEERMPQDASGPFPIDFRDVYYCPENTKGYTHYRFRLRESKGKAWVTAKEDLGSGNSQVSREHEFEVSSKKEFHAFVTLFGFKVLIEKKKTGKKYLVKSALDFPAKASVELVHIEGLGDFVEVELMVEEEQVERAKEEIKRMLEGLGVRQEAIEQRPYTQMLYEKLKE